MPEKEPELPIFRYHPDPIATGSIIHSDERCECCGNATGYVCASGIYSAAKVKSICPWCVASGSAANKFNGSFVDDYPLIDAGLDLAIVREVAERTPGYISWQQEVWMCHCHDACEFHGDATKEELTALTGKVLEDFLVSEMLNETVWNRILSRYQPGGSVAIYKFRCRHCGEAIFTLDCS